MHDPNGQYKYIGRLAKIFKKVNNFIPNKKIIKHQLFEQTILKLYYNGGVGLIYATKQSTNATRASNAYKQKSDYLGRHAKL